MKPNLASMNQESLYSLIFWLLSPAFSQLSHYFSSLRVFILKRSLSLQSTSTSTESVWCDQVLSLTQEFCCSDKWCILGKNFTPRRTHMIGLMPIIPSDLALRCIPKKWCKFESQIIKRKICPLVLLCNKT